MNRRIRYALFVPFGIAFLALFFLAIRGLPAVGNYRGPYGDVLNAVAVTERHSTDVVSAVNFDYRGFDTLGEESILFASVIGATLLLRKQPGEEKGKPQEQAPQRHVPEMSDAVRVLALGLAAPTVLFGIYVVVHGQITPGGGFQGGLVLATVPLLIYLAGDLGVFQKIISHGLVEFSEAAGIAGFVLIGAAGLVFGGRFLQNVIPLGPVDANVYSGGTIPLISIATGLAVTGGFVLLLMAFLEETLELRLRRRRK
jgi:multicomponent Na+:H+ antiporter subunit B